MEVILLEKVAHLGDIGATVKVRPGFGRNYLIPTGKALSATKENKAYFESQRAELEKVAKERYKEALKRAESLHNVKLSLSVQASEEGKLFGSVGAPEVVRALQELGHECSRQEVQLSEGPIRVIGEHVVVIHLAGSEIKVDIQVSIVAA